MEFQILDYIQEHIRCGFLDAILPWITHVGSGYVIIIVAIALIAFKKTRKIGIESTAALLLMFIILNLILKNLIARDRPCWINDTVEMLVKVPKDYSFPSGHSAVAAIMATIVTANNKKAGIPVIIFALIVMFSRLYLYVHFPTDVLAGAIIGLIIAFTVLFAAKKIEKRESYQVDNQNDNQPPAASRR